MVRTTRPASKPTPAITEQFPYSGELECPICGVGFALDPGDLWVLVALDGKPGAAAPCPEGCNAFGTALAGRGESWAAAPEVFLVDRLAPPPPPTRTIRARSSGDKITIERIEPPDFVEGDALAAEEERYGPEEDGYDAEDPKQNPYADMGVQFYRPRPNNDMIGDSVSYEALVEQDRVKNPARAKRVAIKDMTVR